MRFSGYRLGKQGLTCTRRTHKQSSFRQLGADLRVFTRIVKEVYDLRQRLLRLVFTGYIAECNSGLFLYVYLGVALAYAHDTAASADTAHHKVK